MTRSEKHSSTRKHGCLFSSIVSEDSVGLKCEERNELAHHFTFVQLVETFWSKTNELAATKSKIVKTSLF